MAYTTITEGFYASYNAGTTQDPVIIGWNAGAGRSIGAQLSISSGNGKVQTTFDPVSKIIDGTATWVDWSAGAVTTSTQATLSAATTGVRVSRTSGTVALAVSIR